jgi:hypothetical protein
MPGDIIEGTLWGPVPSKCCRTQEAEAAVRRDVAVFVLLTGLAAVPSEVVAGHGAGRTLDHHQLG